MEVERLCSELVKINTENPPGNTESAVSFIAELFDERKIPYVITGNEGGRDNILTDFGEMPLLLAGHLDVVPAIADRWERDPFGGDIDGGFVHGRGSTDMKGGCAALLSAFFMEYERKGRVNANLCFVCDEENGGRYGMRHIVEEKLFEPCDCLIAEPTPALNPSIGQKGLLRINLDFTGKPGHGSLYPHVGDSAIMNALDFMGFVRDLGSRDFEVEPGFSGLIDDSATLLGDIFDISGIENVLRRITYNPGTISGGEKTNIVAEKCSLDLEMRIPWGCSPEELLCEITDHAGSATIKIMESGNPSVTGADTDIVKNTCSSIEGVYQSRSFPFVQWAATDARFLRDVGFSALEYGPGEIDLLHAIDEKVSVANLRRSVDVYSSLIRRYV
ncbi:M20/M25/M40 family metallo-hydrolase [Methanoplanus endosymbiosus]|uniref:M20/M25/M40 family metallo-hydrolase n=1 Tax=Methanoplanus endosymbiosus TaxID=33865 RepID=A0A9E7PLK1_9EURY|nr:M20/M25/M40 family metallo-hydrolase [Methanoplanus endosymbiosus]UUX92374.1 M20/M25/M40 family metallo-hydrolase [Methanoplanus endosymbiosus]